MRRARRYSIVDHAILHGEYFKKLRHADLALYLFFILVGDGDGKSFYSEALDTHRQQHPTGASLNSNSVTAIEQNESNGITSNGVEVIREIIQKLKSSRLTPPQTRSFSD